VHVGDGVPPFIRGHQRSSEVISTHLVHVGDGVPPFEDHDRLARDI
jgi:hypothetical protein